jgi:beta-glucanase (GH16 family)
LNFWFFGTNTGDEITFQLKDNRAPDPGPSEWSLVWSEEFNDPAGTPPDSNYWSHEIGDGTVNRIPGWGNSELQYYTDSTENSATDGAGNLVITAKESTDEFACYYGPCEYTSARLISQYKAEFAYGRIESRIKVPQGDGLWPAFWSLGTDIGEVGWPQTGEIDIMEFVGREPYEVFGTIHGPGYSGGASFGDTYTFGVPVYEDYHTFAIEWEPDLIRWYVDDILYHTATPADVAPNEWVFNDPIFIIFNVAIGGNFGGPVGEDTTFPQEMVIDYLRVYQGPDTAERWETTFTDNFSGWQQVTIPFESLTRSAEQPDGAPDDGLTLNEVWGYNFVLPEGGTRSGVLYLDQLRLNVPPPVTGNIIDDFEAGLPETWFQYGDYGAGTSIDLATILVADRPGGEPETSVLSVDYVSAGWGAGTGRDLTPPQDWSAFSGLSFWFHGTNSGTTFELILSDNKSDPSADTAERFHATFTDDFAGWQHISLPWSVFYRGSWQPPGAPDDGLTLTEMWAYAIALPSGTSGTFYIDEVALVE